ncbi:WD40 repeat-like protein, partial [Serendipita vermifera]
MTCSQAFEEATRIYQVTLQAEALKIAQLGPEKPRPLGIQHKSCLRGTREPILGEIREWAKDNMTEKRIFWLCDIGGSGKSTVAFTMAQEWDNADNTLLGRFFFSKNARETEDTQSFCSIIARDLGSKHPEMNSAITKTFESDSLLSSRSFEVQFDRLITKPLSSISQNIMLAIDAVDECKREPRQVLLKTLVEQLDLIPNMKVLVTSRPDTDILHLLQGKAVVRGMHFQMQGADNQSNIADISVYVEHHLQNLLSSKLRQQLVTQSNGLFIWVSTARLELELAADNPHQFQSTLESLLERGEGGDLQTLYLGILTRVLRGRSKDLIGRILATIATLYEPVSVSTLHALMQTNEEELELIVKSMRSVFRVENVVEFLHPTFREYLDEVRKSSLIPSADASHLELALNTLKVLQRDLRTDICDVTEPGRPYPANSEMPNLQAKLSALSKQSPSLFYSCKRWKYHTCQSIQNEQLVKQLCLFLRTKLLNLIELWSLTGNLLLIRTLVDVHRKFEKLHLYEPEKKLCSDIVRLVQKQQWVLQESELHIYSSAMLFLPKETELSHTYKGCFEENLPEIVCGVPTGWPTHQVLLGRGGSLSHFAFSPDSSRLASIGGSSLQFWDTATGACISTFEMDYDKASASRECMSFSPNGDRFVDASWDTTLTFFNPRSGQRISKATAGHASGINCLAFSSDGTRIVSGSWDKTIILWDAKTGNRVGTAWEGHTQRVSCLAFSPDGTRVLSGSEDGTIRLWDAVTGENVGAPFRGHTWIDSLIFLPGGTRFVSLFAGGRVQVWDITTGETSKISPEGRKYCHALSPDGTMAIYGFSNKKLELWDCISGKKIGALPDAPKSPNACLTISPNGTQFVSGSVDGRLSLWDTKVLTGPEKVLVGHSERVHSIAISPDGTKLASCSHDDTLLLWHLAPDSWSENDMMRQIHSFMVMAISPDGSRVGASSLENTFQVWDVATGATIGDISKG